MELPEVAASLAAIHLNDPFALLATYFCGSPGLHKFTGSVPAHNDNHPLVEFSRIPTKEMLPEVYQELLKCRETVLLNCQNFEAFGQPDTVRNQILRLETGMKNLMADFFTYRMFGAMPDQQETVTGAITSMRKYLDSETATDFGLIQYVDLVSHQNLTEDKKYFEAAFVKAPQFAKAVVLLGLEQASRNEWPKALAFYQQALEINPQYPTAWLNAGYAQTQLQQWEPAKFAFEKLLALDPENPFAYSTLAQVHYMRNDFSKAIECMHIAIKNQPEQANLYFNLGRMYQKNNQIDQARKAIQKPVSFWNL
jgi:tetratricopeptide (TPR) repeat protein